MVMKEYFSTANFSEELETRTLTVGILEDYDTVTLNPDCLSFNEWGIYRGFKVDKRRNQFLAGRYIAKETIRKEHPGMALGAINIVHGVWGFPLIHSDSLNQATISICHADHYAAALFFASNTHPVGIDLEEISENNLPAFKRFISEEEQSLIKSENLPFLEMMHLLWSAKEAVGKALKVGFAIPEEIYSIASISLTDNIYHLVFEKLPMLKVAGWLHGDHAVCIAFPSVWFLSEIKRRTDL
ncbi:4'-phosphopantetheinyl transferase superfamily protein [bacterium]|nr:4'-phosphopantetheinyl transferase superfamily protein [bacterium]